MSATQGTLMDFLPQEAISTIVKDGAWAAAFVLVFVANIWLTTKLLSHSKSGYEVQTRIAVALEALTGRIDGKLLKGGQDDAK